MATLTLPNNNYPMILVVQNTGRVLNFVDITQYPGEANREDYRLSTDTFTITGQILWFGVGWFMWGDYFKSTEGMAIAISDQGSLYLTYPGLVAVTSQDSAKLTPNTWTAFTAKVTNKTTFSLTYNNTTVSGTNSKNYGVRVLPHSGIWNSSGNVGGGGKVRNLVCTY